MPNHYEKLNNTSLESYVGFVPPSIEHEVGEFERVATTFGKSDAEKFIRNFVEALKNESLTPLSDDIWAKLENTDSWDIDQGDWAKVAENADQVNRDWQSIKQAMEAGKNLDAPIIAKHGNTYHLVSGNTRLMVAKAGGAQPKVVIVAIDEF